MVAAVGALSGASAPWSGTPCSRPCISVDRVGAGGSSVAATASDRNPLRAGRSTSPAAATWPGWTTAAAFPPSSAKGWLYRCVAGSPNVSATRYRSSLVARCDWSVLGWSGSFQPSWAKRCR
jgi:hypothetical protein